MSLDRWLSELKDEERSGGRIERQSTDCLEFAAIERLARDGSAGGSAHVESCARCRELLERMRGAIAEPVLLDESTFDESLDPAPTDGRIRTGRDWMRSLAPIVLAAAAVLIAVGIFAIPEGESPAIPTPGGAPELTRVSLADIFEEGVDGGILEELLTRTYEESNPSLGESELLEGGVVRHVASIRGPRLFGFCNPDPLGTFVCGDRDCRGREPSDGSPCDDPATPATCRESRLTVEIFLPPNAADPDLASDERHLVALQMEDPEAGPNTACGQKRALLTSLAREGHPGVLWYEKDAHPFPADAEPTPRLCRQFGFDSDAALQVQGYRWMMMHEQDELELADLRYDVRFAHAQAFLLATTFVQAFVRERVFEGDRAGDAWASGLRVVLAGDALERCDTGLSGEGGVDGGCMTAAGIDPRVDAVLVGSALGLRDGPGSGYHRYESDWSLCAAPSVDCAIRLDAATVDPWRDFSAWAWSRRDDRVSYFNAYLPVRDPGRYEDLLILDIAATHEWRTPLGSNTTRATADGDPEWNIRHVRRINRDRGVALAVGTDGERTVTAGELLLRRALGSLSRGASLPRVELVDFDTSDRRRFRARIRVDETGSRSDPARARDGAHRVLGRSRLPPMRRADPMLLDGRPVRRRVDVPRGRLGRQQGRRGSIHLDPDRRRRCRGQRALPRHRARDAAGARRVR